MSQRTRALCKDNLDTIGQPMTLEVVLCKAYREEHRDLGPHITCLEGSDAAEYVREALRQGKLLLEDLLLDQRGTPTYSAVERQWAKEAHEEMIPVLAEALRRCKLKASGEKDPLDGA